MILVYFELIKYPVFATTLSSGNSVAPKNRTLGNPTSTIAVSGSPIINGTWVWNVLVVSRKKLSQVEPVTTAMSGDSSARVQLRYNVVIIFRPFVSNALATFPN